MDRVTVTAYRKREHADIAKDTLDTAGIDAAVEEAKVRVHNVDAIRAGTLLTEHCETLDEVFEADEEAEPLVCTSCGSTNVVATHRLLTFGLIATIVLSVGIAVELGQAAFLALLASAVLLLISGRWRCGDCGDTVR